MGLLFDLPHENCHCCCRAGLSSAEFGKTFIFHLVFALSPAAKSYAAYMAPNPSLDCQIFLNCLLESYVIQVGAIATRFAHPESELFGDRSIVSVSGVIISQILQLVLF